MCGILGTNQPIPIEAVHAMLGEIAHRGPDDAGLYVDEFVRLGHHRLSILDVSSNGHQPMSILDGQIWIVFNGEIYNHLELRREMGNEFQYRSTSDTETILYGYLKYGKAIVQKLNGIFSFAIYDKRVNELFVARDHLGVKPLYYYYKDGLLIFASEIKAIIRYSGVDKAIVPRVLVDYLHFLWAPDASTPFKFVKKLPPGQYFTSKIGSEAAPRITKYYELPFSGEYSRQSEADLIDELDSLLNQAVKRQLLSDVPVGFFLSGGLDSSLITAIARKQLQSSFNCYSIEVPESDRIDDSDTDLAFAKQLAKQLDVRLIPVRAHSEMVSRIDMLTWHLDEPQSDPAPFNVFSIASAARSNGDVVLLGGTGADDLFSGYRRHQALRYEPLMKLIPGFAISSLTSLLGLVSNKSRFFRQWQKLVQRTGASQTHRRAQLFGWTKPETMGSIFSNEMQSQIGDYDPNEYLVNSLKNIPNERSALNQMLYWELKFFLPDHNLNYSDKMSMAAGVEKRVPYLDLDLVAFACRLPPKMKLRGRTTKYLLRKVAERYLPKEIIYRPKAGFGAPVRQWFVDGKMDQAIQRLLSGKLFSSAAIFSKEGVIKLVEDTRAGTIDGAYTVWSLLAIDAWFRLFVDNQSDGPPLQSRVPARSNHVQMIDGAQVKT